MFLILIQKKPTILEVFEDTQLEISQIKERLHHLFDFLEKTDKEIDNTPHIINQNGITSEIKKLDLK